MADAREPEIALVFTPEPWVTELHRYFTDHGGITITDLVIEQRLALETATPVIVASHRWPALTASFVDAVHAQRRVVVGVHNPDEPASQAFLASVGVDATIACDADMATFVDIITLVAPSPQSSISETPMAAPLPERSAIGQSIVIGGATGSGRTEIACGLHAEFAKRGATSVLIDADDVAPSVATRLALPIEPNIRNAIDAAVFALHDLETAFVAFPNSSSHVICGLPNSAAWTQLRPSDVATTVSATLRTHQYAVVDTHGALDVIDSAPRDRNEVARSLLEVADQIVCVAEPTPTGVARSMLWLTQCRAVAPTTPIHLVINGAPRGAFRAHESIAEITRSVAIVSTHVVIRDAGVERAHWRGAIVHRSPFRKAVSGLATAITTTSIDTVIDLRADSDDVMLDVLGVKSA